MGHVPSPHFLTDQLTLSQQGGAHYPHPVPSRIFRPCNGPVDCHFLAEIEAISQDTCYVFTKI